MKDALQAVGVAGGHYQAIEAERGGTTLRVLHGLWPERCEMRELEAPGAIEALGLGPSVVLANGDVHFYDLDQRRWTSIGSMRQEAIPPPPATRSFVVERGPKDTRVLVRALQDFSSEARSGGLVRKGESIRIARSEATSVIAMRYAEEIAGVR